MKTFLSVLGILLVIPVGLIIVGICELIAETRQDYDSIHLHMKHFEQINHDRK